MLPAALPSKAHSGLNVAAVLDPTTKQWRYTLLYGLAFGLGTAVNQFNRVPALLTAVARRLLYLLASHYVHDNVIAELLCLTGHGPRMFTKLADMMGIGFADNKSAKSHPSCQCCWASKTTCLELGQTTPFVSPQARPGRKARANSQGMLVRGDAHALRSVQHTRQCHLARFRPRGPTVPRCHVRSGRKAVL